MKEFTEEGDFEDLTEASRETAAPPETQVRKSVITKSVSGSNCTALSHREVTIEVTSYNVEKKQNFIGKDFVVF